MEREIADSVATMRILESWLPLAQAENERYAWGYNGAELEQLIMRAAPALRLTSSVLAAQAVLWYYHGEQQRVAE
ncbi:MAG: hypothetical protein HC822_19095 [Oscillochloris sp.]|nr:hypothetical protein [Oscillochloris sp.]